MMRKNNGYSFCIYFTRLFDSGKILYHDYVRYCDKESTVRTVAYYLTCKDIKNVRVEYFGERV